jgi:branched-chain amino acid transport system permease protein
VSAFWQQVVSGLADGGIYGALALAIVLIYRATGVVSFAHGELGTFTTFVCWWIVAQHGLPYWPGVALTLVAAFVLGVLVQRIVMRPFAEQPQVIGSIVTIGLFIAFNALTGLLWGTEQKTLRPPFPTHTIRVGGVALSIEDLGVIAVSLAIVGLLALFFRSTRVGLAMRAAALEPESSRLHGIRVGWMLALGWGLSVVLAAVAGLETASPSFDPNMMVTVLIYAFAAAVLGGLESPFGAVVGGLVLGVALNLLGNYVNFVGSQLRLPVALALLFCVLLVRPTGLFGRVGVRRV